MKTIFTRLSVLTIAFLFFNCSSDSSDSSTPTPIVLKTKVKITKVDVTTIPSTNGIVDWDFSSHPDIYFKIYDELGNLAGFTTSLSNTFPSILNPITASFSNIYTTDLINTVIKVQVWDDDLHDSPSNSDDLIGEVPFYIHDYIVESNKYPSFAVKAYGGTVVTIYMTWE